MLESFTVLISVYFKELPENLDNSLYSIWDNQCLKPYQIVLVCDGVLTEGLNSLIGKWKSKLQDVLLIIQLDKNIGLAKALNVGLLNCKYEYVARMDSDDFAHKDRFLLQFNFLKSNPDISVLGTSMYEFKDKIENITSNRNVPVYHNEIKKKFKYFCPINHPTVMYKKSAILSVNGYNNIFLKEDLDLWLRLLIKGYKFHNLNEKLFFYRISDNFYQRRGGIKYSLSELKLIHFRFNKNLINIFEYIYMCSVVLPIRLSPVFFRKIIYKYILR